MEGLTNYMGAPLVVTLGLSEHLIWSVLITNNFSDKSNAEILICYVFMFIVHINHRHLFKITV